jgi:hypothetical protein
MYTMYGRFVRAAAVPWTQDERTLWLKYRYGMTTSNWAIMFGLSKVSAGRIRAMPGC